ncbi:class I SAM-dependent methyltransferase [Oxynema sp. CENA135]|nr:class I SAM-dependent methyltransferase [Oxynema sp. CENA135]
MERDLFKYHLDSPQPNGEISTPFLPIAGWIAVKSDVLIKNLSLCDRDRSISYSLNTGDRPDVESAYPGYRALGFHYLLSLQDLSASSSLSITFKIEDKIYDFPIHFSIEATAIAAFEQKKSEKLTQISSILQCPICQHPELSQFHRDVVLKCNNCHAEFTGDRRHFNFLNSELIDYGNIEATANVSAFGYDAVASGLIEQFGDGLILDNGCGLKRHYYQNVVNLEIVDYPTTDVLAIGEKLPLKSNSFDAVFSFLVLEHVRHPFECAQEIMRVLKPGGTLYAIAPFLQPFHGYPNHYYNMTSHGLKNLFQESIEISECDVYEKALPIACLTWFLNSYLRGLPPTVAETFKNMKVADLLKHHRNYQDCDFVTQLSPEVNDELACANYLIGIKR